MSANAIPSTTVEFYWRPGCPFCMQLERSLNNTGIPLDKRNIWEDKKAAEFVRSVADGNETVPTLKIGGRFMVNPSPREVVATVGAELPDLIPEGVEIPEAGRIGRLLQRVLGA